MKNYLLVTLGHNSSAIFVENSADGQKIIGYEQERLSRIKSDSQFPIDAINEIEKNVGFTKMKGCIILISHWFNFEFSNDDSFRECKYFTSRDREKLLSYEPERIEQVNSSFTHHDAHMMSAHAFYLDNVGINNCVPVHYIVADGFGNNKEVLSIYQAAFKGDKPKLISRFYGYKNSLGLMYQYATSFTGMTENKDEYKFLGYEPHISEYCSSDEIYTLNVLTGDYTEKLLTNYVHQSDNNIKMPQCEADVINYKDLEKAKDFWYSVFEKVLASIHPISDDYGKRVVIAYFIQQICENTLYAIIQRYGIHNVVLSGGVFYNVKLNHSILEDVDSICIMPLAGDQGAALGMYEAEDKDDAPKFNFGNLCWGKRKLYAIDKYIKKLVDNGHKAYLYTLEDEVDKSNISKKIAQYIADGYIVNIVEGNMEFGPRALGHTSSLFMPSTANTSYNNILNNRNEVMPCAPMCSYKNAVNLFGITEIRKTIGSDKYMICTHEYNKPYSKTYGGAMHKVTLHKDIYSGRPQIVEDNSFAADILFYVNMMTDAMCIVNTSFNAHGNPIVFDTKDIYDNFLYQCERAKDKEPVLFVIKYN